MNDFAALVRSARTCRRFVEDKPISSQTLRDIVDCTRATTSARNRQPLRYVTVGGAQARQQVFEHAKWASALKWDGPPPGERPTGFVVICSVAEPSMPVYYDTGIAAQTMQLYAASLGIGCCMLNNFPRDPVRAILQIPEDLHIMLLLAFGVPKEERKIAEASPADSLQYWRDDSGVHHVPKLALEHVLLAER